MTQMNDLIVKGTSKFESEVDYSMRVPEDKRYFVKFNEPSSAMPSKPSEKVNFTLGNPDEEEMIATHFDSKVLYA